MKKAVKSGIIWGTTLAALGGITAGITIPILKAKAKVTYTNPLRGFNPDDAILGDITGKQMLDALNETGVKDSSLLSKVQYQLAFDLYSKEQVGSLKLQKIYFGWDLYQVNKNLIDFIVKTMQDNVTIDFGGSSHIALTDLSKKLYLYSDTTERDNLYTKLVEAANATITKKEHPVDDQGNSVALTESEISQIAQYKESLKTLKDGREAKINLEKKLDASIANDNANGIDYDSISFASDFPKVLNKIENIKTKQRSIYNDQKSSFISSYKGAGEGTTEWVKQLSSKYGGATNENGAIDYLVNQQISSSAWAKYQFKVNSEFTVEQLKTNIFKDILGQIDKADIDTKGILNYKGTEEVVFRKEKQEDTDKVYFFSCGTKDPVNINVTDAKKIPSEGLDKIVKINNAILGFKQDTTNPLKSWTVTKEQLTKLFTFFGEQKNLVALMWPKVFAHFGATTGAGGELSDDDKLTKTLIEFFSGTTDATQHNSGDLGWTTQLDALKNYYPGFSLGVAAAMDSYATAGDHIVPHTVDGTAGDNFLGTLMNALKKAFDELWSKTMPSVTVGSVTIGTGTGTAVTNIDDFNKQLADFISKLTDDEVNNNFGKAIQSVMMGIKVDATGKIAATGTALEGLPSAIKISEVAPGDATWMVNADEAGMHIIRIKTLNDPKSAIDEMKKEFVKAAEKQDDTLIATDWGKFVTGSFTTARQIGNAIDLDTYDKTPTDAKLTPIFDIIKKVEDSAYASGPGGTPTATDKDRLVSDVYALVSSLIHSQTLSNVQNAYRDDMYTWLTTKIDNKLWTHLDEYAILPEEIYSALVAAGGK